MALRIRYDTKVPMQFIIVSMLAMLTPHLSGERDHFFIFSFCSSVIFDLKKDGGKILELRIVSLWHFISTDLN